MVLRSGRVKVCAVRSGRELILAVLDPGSLLGEISAVDGSPRSATVVALEAVEIDAIGVDAFRDFMVEHPRVPSQLLAILAERLRLSSARQLEFGSSSTLTRLCAMLVGLSERYGEEVAGGGVIITSPLSQRELASWSGMSREALVKGLHHLRSLGWVSVEERTIVILDPEAVCRRAQTS